MQFKFLKTFILYTVVLSLPLTGFTFTPDLIKAAKAVHAKEATNLQKAMVFAKNKTINHMALSGVIDDDEYQSNQKFFQKENNKFSMQAAKDNNLDCNKQSSSGSPKAGTDTDNILKIIKSGQFITLDQIKRVRKSYNNYVEKFLIKLNPKTKKHIDWAKETDTDFFPSFTDTKEFQQISIWINKKGGTAYSTPYSAEIEFEMRSPLVSFTEGDISDYGIPISDYEIPISDYEIPISDYEIPICDYEIPICDYEIPICDYEDYNNEMTRQIKKTLKNLKRNKRAIKRLIVLNTTTLHLYKKCKYELKNSLAVRHKLSAHLAKYIERKYKVADLLRINHLKLKNPGIESTPPRTPRPSVITEAIKRIHITEEDAIEVYKKIKLHLTLANREFAKALNEVILKKLENLEAPESLSSNSQGLSI